MPQIRIDTNQARDIGRRLIAEGDRLNEIGHELQSAISGLDTGAWDGTSRAQAEPMLCRARPESEHVAQQLDGFGRQLARVADAFEQADSESAARVDTIPWFMPEPLLGWRTSPALRLGSLMAGGGDVATIALLTLPEAGGGSRPSFADRLKDIPSTVARWLSPAIMAAAGWFGWHLSSPGEVVETAPDQPPPTGEVPQAEGELGWTPAPPPPPPPTVTAEIIPGYATVTDLTPALKQTAGSYECAPASVSMVLGYWNKVDPNHQSRTPGEIIQGLDGRFAPKSGINPDELVAGLKEMDLGYKTIEWQSSLDKQTLQSELKEGPVMAQIHLNWGTSGYAHMVTVTGISEDGNTVYANDPWTGEAVEKAWSAFEESWTFGGRYSGASHLIVKVRP